MVFGENSPAITLARQGMYLEQVVHEEHRRRGVTDLTTLMLCQRHARQFLQRRTPVETPATVLGHILHRTIKHLYDRYRVEHRVGQSGWLPGDAEVREECQIAEEAARAQGLPRLPPEKSASLRNMLCAFHAIEAASFYPQVQDAEVNLHWLWEDAPGGPLLLEGKVDVVIAGGDTSHPELYLWDYKTTRQPEPGAEMTSYQWQMRLYAFLYRRHFGVSPQGMVLYFMGELANQRARAGRPARAIYHMPAIRQSDKQTLAWLSRALEIEERCRTSGQWDPPAPEDAPRRMCKNCSIRLSCPAISVPFPWESGAGQDDDVELYDQ